MEVGCSVEVCHKLVVIFRRSITLFWNKHLMGEELLVHNQSSTSTSDCIFLHHILEIKPLSMCIKPLMHGCLTEVTTNKTLVGMAKRWLWLLNGSWTVYQEIISCHDFHIWFVFSYNIILRHPFTIVVAYFLWPSLFSCHFFHDPPFWGAQKTATLSCFPPPLRSC